ncbi:hypothetical protein BGW42_003930 [Actinomortierella wolfii]|nr:hypothetical protein BGW42_003930 [Actinomortierella wolfii]
MPKRFLKTSFRMTDESKAATASTLESAPEEIPSTSPMTESISTQNAQEKASALDQEDAVVRDSATQDDSGSSSSDNNNALFNLVSMSCLLNTNSNNTTEYFGKHDKHLLQKARQLSRMPDFTSHSASTVLAEYRTCLIQHGVEGLRRKTIVDRGVLYGQFGAESLSPEAIVKDKTLRILELLCNFILNPWFPKNDPSESDCLHLWTSVFGILVEKIQIKTCIQNYEENAAPGARRSVGTGRKVDCIFVAEDMEISNIEFKRPNISGTEIAIQNRKNVRQARCIQESLCSLGVQEPVVYMADVQGYAGAFYRICPMGDIAVAGATTEDMVHLPSTPGGLLEFLEDSSLAIMWNYIERTFQKHVMLTPTKKRRM